MTQQQITSSDNTTDMVLNKQGRLVKRRKRKTNPLILRALELIAEGNAKTITEAAQMVGMTPDWIGKQLKRPEMGVMLTQIVNRTLSKGRLRASAKLVELIESQSGKVSLEAAKHTLALTGHAPPPPGVTVNANISVGYILDLRDPAERDREPMTVDHEATS